MAQQPSRMRGTSPLVKNLQAEIQQFAEIRATGAEVNSHGYQDAQRRANVAGGKLKEINAYIRARKGS